MLPRLDTLRLSQRARASAPTSATYDQDKNVFMSESEYLRLTTNQIKKRLPKLVYEPRTEPSPCAPEAAMRNAVEAEVQLQVMSAYTRKVQREWDNMLRLGNLPNQEELDLAQGRWNEMYKVDMVNGWIDEAKTTAVAYPFPTVIQQSMLFSNVVSDIVEIIDERYKNLAFNLVPNLEKKFGMVVAGYVRLICNEPYHERELEPEFGEQLKNLKELLLSELRTNLAGAA